MSSREGALVVGVGNEWRGDDGAGLVVARALREARPDLRVIELGGDPVDLLDALATAEIALIVDATRTGGEPGMVRRLCPTDAGLADTLPHTSSHVLGLADTLALARALDRLPPTVLVYGIEGQSFARGTGLSTRVAEAVATVVDAIVAELGGPARPGSPSR